MKEIGGFFGLEQLISNEYYKELIPLNSGRNALLYILKSKNIKKLFIPYYLCKSISDLLRMYGYDFDYYKIDSNFMPIFNKALADAEYLYIVNYYGQLTNDRISSLKKQYNQIILDNTQAFFQSPIKGIDTIYNCRKFFGVPDGAYLYTDSEVKLDLELDISKDSMTHILGRYEGIASEYYNDFKNMDESFKYKPLKYMSRLTHNILGAIDYQRVYEIRKRNYEYLHRKLGKFNRLKLVTPSGAFSYPVYVENSSGIKKELAKKKIYIPTLWPSVLSNMPYGSVEHDYASNILPLPCDQRYGLDDMDCVISGLYKVIGNAYTEDFI